MARWGQLYPWVSVMKRKIPIHELVVFYFTVSFLRTGKQEHGEADEEATMQFTHKYKCCNVTVAHLKPNWFFILSLIQQYPTFFLPINLSFWSLCYLLPPTFSLLSRHFRSSSSYSFFLQSLSHSPVCNDGCLHGIADFDGYYGLSYMVLIHLTVPERSTCMASSG